MIKKIWGFVKNKWRKPIFYLPATIVVVVLFFVFTGNGGGSQYDLLRVERGTLYEEVNVTGKTKAVESADLSFERIGKVASIIRNVGDKVYTGEVLVRLDATSEILDLNQAEASLESDQATLGELLRGSRPEDLAIEESKVLSAENSVKDSRRNLLDKIKDAYTKSDDAVRNYADQFFSNPRSSSPDLDITVSDYQLETDINTLRVDVERALVSWQDASPFLNLDSDLFSASLYARNNLNLAASFLDKLSLAVNSLTSTQSLTLTTINTYKSSISTARTAVNTAITNLSTAEEGLNNAIDSLDLAEKNLALIKAGTASEKIEAQKAKVRAGEAKVRALRYQIGLANLYSPINGILAKQDARIGEIVSVGKVIAEVISDGGFEIEAFVPEVDIGNMVVGNVSFVTLDAFPSEEFEARVSYIEPAETVIDGVPTYKIKLAFDSSDERIKPGMTANLVIRTAERRDTLYLSFRAVYGRNGERYVKLLQKDGSMIEMPVQVGIRGSDGEVEILSGLEEGTEVVIDK